jgi:superfamily II DNA or RNA helicase
MLRAYNYYKLSDKGEEDIVEHYERNENFALRPNQQQVVDNFEKAVKSGRKNLLMYAVMRFGKSAVSAWCSKKMGAKLTVIAVVKQMSRMSGNAPLKVTKTLKILYS